MNEPAPEIGVYVIEQHRHVWRLIRDKYLACVHIGGDGERCSSFAYLGCESDWGIRMYRVIDEHGEVLIDRRMESGVRRASGDLRSGDPIMRTHECPAPECGARISMSLFACRSHWYALSPATRSEIWATVSLPVIHPDRLAVIRRAAREWERQAGS